VPCWALNERGPARVGVMELPEMRTTENVNEDGRSHFRFVLNGNGNENDRSHFW